MSRVRAMAPSVALVLVGALASGCTSDSSSGADSPAEPTPAPSSSPGSPPEPAVTLTRPDAELDVDIVQLRGGVPPDARPRLAEQLAAPVAGWIDAGFLVDDYPRAAFGDAFRTWTAPAAALAQRDSDVTTMAAEGDDLVAVVADRQRVRLFVFAENGRSGGATARVLLEMTGERTDGSVRRFEVSGELYLTPTGRSWQIFGYDLQRTGRS